MKNIIGCVLVMFAFMLLIGSVGALECNTIGFLACGIRSAISFLIGGVGIALFDH